MNLDNATNWVSYRITRGPIKGNMRNRIGLIINIKTNKDVEAFMSQLAGDRKVSIDSYGDMWHSCEPDDKQLEVYVINDDQFKGKNYTLGQVGLPFITSTPDYNEEGGLRRNYKNTQDLINISFLRLAGVSSPDGVSLGLIGAYSTEHIEILKKQLPGATNQFLKDYIIPVTVNLHLIQQ